jgi:hypothetical protein
MNNHTSGSQFPGQGKERFHQSPYKAHEESRPSETGLHNISTNTNFEVPIVRQYNEVSPEDGDNRE